MTKQDKDNPKEIQKPLRDPLGPDDDNPINPKKDEPMEDITEMFSVRFQCGLL